MSASLGLSFSCLRSCHLVWDAVSASLGLSPGLSSILSSAWDAVSGLVSQLVSGLVSQLVSFCRLACVRFFNLVLYRLALRWSGFDSSSLRDLMAFIVIQPAKRKRNTEEHPNPKHARSSCSCSEGSSWIQRMSWMRPF